MSTLLLKVVKIAGIAVAALGLVGQGIVEGGFYNSTPHWLSVAVGAVGAAAAIVSRIAEALGVGVPKPPVAP